MMNNADLEKCLNRLEAQVNLLSETLAQVRSQLEKLTWHTHSVNLMLGPADAVQGNTGPPSTI